MNNIITTANLETITSMEAAQMIEKDHAKLLRDIHRYINQIEKINETKTGQSKIGFTDFSLNLHILLHRIKFNLATISLIKVANL